MYEKIELQRMAFEKEGRQTEWKFRCLEIASRFASSTSELITDATKLNNFVLKHK
jgi:hypothetical protein